MNDINGLIKGIVKDLVSSELKSLRSKSNEPHKDMVMYSETEAAKFLKRSTVTMWRLRKSGVISYSKYGKKIMYSHDDLMLFIKENKVDRL